MIVDPETPEGKSFLEVRPLHVEKAWRDVIGILEKEGADKELKEAVIKQQDMAASGGSF